MKEIIKYYETRETSFSIKLNKNISGNIIVPIYPKMPSNVKFDSMATGISEEHFDEDMVILIPEKLGDDWAESCFNQLQIRLRMHYKQYGRIQPSDLECFIGEFILVMSNIGEAINQPMSISDKQKFFKKLLTDISEELNIPIEIPL